MAVDASTAVRGGVIIALRRATTRGLVAAAHAKANACNCLKIRCTTYAPGWHRGHREGEELTTSHAPEPDAASSGSDDDASEQSEAFSHEISRASSSGLASDERRALAVSASNWRTSKAPGARMLVPSPTHEVMPVHRVSRSRRD